MVDPALTAEIIASIADERGLPPEKVKLSDRLRDDLGMDGDDAVEFFVGFQKRYGVDLTSLYEHWDRHFAGEGCGPWWIVIFPVSLLACAVLVYLRVDPVLALLPLPIGFPLMAYYFVRDRIRRRDRPYRAVTVGDLVNAASAGRWCMTYD